MATLSEEEKKESGGNTSSSNWDCSICLDGATDPVVTQCGHLFCWECIRTV